jgi:large subunit ribosomal protein L5
MLGFKELYAKEIIPALMQELGLANSHEVPKLVKISLNMGIGEAVADKKLLDSAAEELALIAGQKPVVTKARKSISTFKLREGMPIGTKVDLRKDKMYSFLERLVYIALPRSRDFRGLNSNNFDGNGNLNIGIKEHIVFPEIDYDKISKVKGLNVTIVTTAKNDEHAKALLKKFNIPFVN